MRVEVLHAHHGDRYDTATTRFCSPPQIPRKHARRGGAGSLAGYACAAGAETPSDKWTFVLTPYLWLPTIHGTLNYSTPPGDPGSPSTEVGPTTIWPISIPRSWSRAGDSAGYARRSST